MQILKQTNCEIHHQELNLFSNIKIFVPKNREEELLYKLKDLYGLDFKKII